MRQLMVAFGILLLLNGAAVSQCSALTVSGSFNPGQTIGLSVTGATPNAFAYVLAGDPGVTTISLRLPRKPHGGVVAAVRDPADRNDERERQPLVLDPDRVELLRRP